MTPNPTVAATLILAFKAREDAYIDLQLAETNEAVDRASREYLTADARFKAARKELMQ